MTHTGARLNPGTLLPDATCPNTVKKNVRAGTHSLRVRPLTSHLLNRLCSGSVIFSLHWLSRSSGWAFLSVRVKKSTHTVMVFFNPISANRRSTCENKGDNSTRCRCPAVSHGALRLYVSMNKDYMCTEERETETPSPQTLLFVCVCV